MNIRSLLIGLTFAATLPAVASPPARAQGLLAELATTAVFDACPRLLGQDPPVARPDPSPEARALVEFFTQSPSASDYSTDAVGGRLHVSRVPTSPTEVGCLVRISGPSRNSAIAAVTQFAGSAGSGWSKPEARRYFSRLLLVSIYDAGTHFLMIPSQGTSESDGIVISKIDLGGHNALEPAPDNTAPLMRAALEVCAPWSGGDLSAETGSGFFEGNQRVSVSKATAPFRSCVVKAQTTNPPDAGERLRSALIKHHPDLVEIQDRQDLRALGYEFVSKTCVPSNKQSTLITITATPISNGDPFRLVTVSFINTEVGCRDMARGG